MAKVRGIAIETDGRTIQKVIGKAEKDLNVTRDKCVEVPNGGQTRNPATHREEMEV